MTENSNHVETIFAPKLGGLTGKLNAFARDLQIELELRQYGMRAELAKEKRQKQDRAKSRYNGIYGNQLYLAENILLDLVCAGWKVHVSRGTIRLSSNDQPLETPVDDRKNAVRETLRGQRDQQLEVTSVREFLKKMETYRQGPDGWVSVLSLMRDGTELYDKLAMVDPSDAAALEATNAAIKPYIQFVESGKVCDITGLRLSDIWRYFRHTWLTPYKSIPGRSISILIRDAATKHHAIIGIAALGSSVIQLDSRDRYIGWHPDQIIGTLRGNPSKNRLQWLKNSLTSLLSEIYVTDLVRDQIVTRRCLRKPSEEDVQRLHEESKRAKQRHRLLARRETHKHKSKKSASQWKREAETDLFRAKRCTELAQLLRIKIAFNESRLFEVHCKEKAKDILQNHTLRAAIRMLSKKIKATRAGINIMDLIVCGAIAPYTHLLGGKLVAMLMVSPEVSRYYAAKYREAASVIASSMQGKKVVREPKLVFLGTTSLFGSGASQYNRISIPVSIFDRKESASIAFNRLGITEGFGSVHFSQRTIDAMSVIINQSSKGRRVNSIFGEGVSPLLRKIRDGLNTIGLQSEEFIKHRNSRIIYGVPLIENLDSYLIGLSSRPQYLVPQTQSKMRSEQIVDFWRERWLLSRLNYRPAVESLKLHTLDHPLQHGAVVRRPHEEQTFELPFGNR